MATTPPRPDRRGRRRRCRARQRAARRGPGARQRSRRRRASRRSCWLATGSTGRRRTRSSRPIPDLDVFEALGARRLDRLRERARRRSRGGPRLLAGRLHGAPLRRVLREAGDRARSCSTPGRRVDAYTTNDFANQPLHAAAAGRHIEVCRVLIAAGADVNATQHGGYTPLHEAAQHGDVEMVELFLSAGADPTIARERRWHDRGRPRRRRRPRRCRHAACARSPATRYRTVGGDLDRTFVLLSLRERRAPIA